MAGPDVAEVGNVGAGVERVVPDGLVAAGSPVDAGREGGNSVAGGGGRRGHGLGGFGAQADHVDFEDIQFNRRTGTLSVSIPAKAGVSYTVKFITTKSGANTEPVRTVELPQQDDRPARSVPVYSDAVGTVVKTVAFGNGETASASYTLAADDLYVRARVESSEPATYQNAINRMHPPMKVAWTQPYRKELNRLWYIRDVSV